MTIASGLRFSIRSPGAIVAGNMGYVVVILPYIIYVGNGCYNESISDLMRAND